MGIVYLSGNGTPYGVDNKNHMIMGDRLREDYTFLGITDWAKADALAKQSPGRPQVLFELYQDKESGFPEVEEIPFEKVKCRLHPSLVQRIEGGNSIFEKAEIAREYDGKPAENTNIALLFINKDAKEIVMPSAIAKYQSNSE